MYPKKLTVLIMATLMLLITVTSCGVKPGETQPPPASTDYSSPGPGDDYIHISVYQLTTGIVIYKKGDICGDFSRINLGQVWGGASSLTFLGKKKKVTPNWTKLGDGMWARIISADLSAELAFDPALWEANTSPDWADHVNTLKEYGLCP